MRRKDREMTEEFAYTISDKCEWAVVSMIDPQGLPYCVPLSIVRNERSIYFHCAKSGHKLDAIRRDPRVCFTVVDEDTIVPEEYTSYFRSVILFGRAAAVEGEERTSAFLALAAKYSGSLPETSRREEVARCRQALIIGISIDHMTGKEAIEYARQQEK